MPGGISSGDHNYLAFAVIKFAGYTLAAWHLNRRYADATSHFALVGITRTIIGMIFGAALGLVAYRLMVFGGLGLLVFLVGLIPVRLIEWWIIIRLFYDQSMQNKEKDWKYVFLGTMWSFALDIPALLGFIGTGGFWIC